MPVFSQQSGIDEPENIVLRDEEGWAKAWQRIQSRSRPVPPAPPVDFEREMIVVAALGRQRSGGYTIRIDRAYREGPATVVIVYAESPGEGCIVTNALTSPVDIARLPLSAEPVEIRVETTSRDCK